MLTRITPHLIDLVYTALLNSFWRKEALKRFLRSCEVPDALVSSYGEGETKRNFLDRLLPIVQKEEVAVIKVTQALIQQTSFPDLQGWENSEEMTANATEAVRNLKTYINEQDKQIELEKSKSKIRKDFAHKQQEVYRQQTAIGALTSRLNALCTELGTQDAGYKFQDWFYDFVAFYDITHRKPYVF